MTDAEILDAVQEDMEGAQHHKEQLDLQRDLEGIVRRCARVLTADEAALLRWATGVSHANQRQVR